MLKIVMGRRGAGLWEESEIQDTVAESGLPFNITIIIDSITRLWLNSSMRSVLVPLSGLVTLVIIPHRDLCHTQEQTRLAQVKNRRGMLDHVHIIVDSNIGYLNLQEP